MAKLCARDRVNGIWRRVIDGGAPQRLSGLPEEQSFPYGWSRAALSISRLACGSEWSCRSDWCVPLSWTGAVDPREAPGGETEVSAELEGILERQRQ